MSDVRLVKVPMPLGLIRRMDEAVVRGQGGFSTRAEFLQEAAENLLVELTYDEAPPEPRGRPAEARAPAPSSDGRPGEPIEPDGDASESALLVPLEVLDAVPAWEREELRRRGPGRQRGACGSWCRRRERRRGQRAGPAAGSAQPRLPEPRAAHRRRGVRARISRPYREFVDRATVAAWVFAAGLQSLERAGGGERLTALFPTNATKRAAAERAFQNFAVGCAR